MAAHAQAAQGPWRPAAAPAAATGRPPPDACLLPARLQMLEMEATELVLRLVGLKQVLPGCDVALLVEQQPRWVASWRAACRAGTDPGSAMGAVFQRCHMRCDTLLQPALPGARWLSAAAHPARSPCAHPAPSPPARAACFWEATGSSWSCRWRAAWRRCAPACPAPTWSRWLSTTPASCCSTWAQVGWLAGWWCLRACLLPPMAACWRCSFLAPFRWASRPLAGPEAGRAGCGTRQLHRFGTPRAHPLLGLVTALQHYQHCRKPPKHSLIKTKPITAQSQQQAICPTRLRQLSLPAALLCPMSAGIAKLKELWDVDEQALRDSDPFELALAVRALSTAGPPRKF
jgi:hypothetical protein